MVDSKVHSRCLSTIFAYQHKPSLKFYPKLFESATTITDYEGWETTGLQVTFSDFKTKSVATLSYRQIDMQLDHNNDFTLEARRISQLVNELPAKLGIEKFTRIGLRRKYLIPVSMEFAQLVCIMQEKFIAKNPIFEEAFPGTFQDLMFRFDYLKNSTRFLITLGPVRKVEAQNHIPPNKKHFDRMSTKEAIELLDSYPDTSMLIDIDAFIGPTDEGTPINQLATAKDNLLKDLEVAILALRKHVFASEVV